MRRLINDGKIKRIYIHPYNKEHADAIDETHRLFEHLKDQRPPRIVSSLYQAEGTDDIFKKLLVKEIFKLVYTSRYLEKELQPPNPLLRICFVPETFEFYRNLLKSYGCRRVDLPPGIGLFRWGRLIASIVGALDKMKYLSASAVFILWRGLALSLRKLSAGKGEKTAPFKHVVAMNYGSQVKFTNGRDLDLFFDGVEIRQDNTLFLFRFPINVNALESLKKKGYHILQSSEICGRASFPFGTVEALVRMPACWNSPPVFIRAFYVSLNTLIHWHLVLRDLPILHYLYANEEGADQIALNILLKKQGCRTWNYPLFLGGAFTHARNGDFRSCQNIMWSFLNPDTLFVVNGDATNYYKLHHQSTKNYVSIGCLFSELVRIKQGNLRRDEALSGLFGRKSTARTRVIAFYDTSFIDAENCPSSFEDAISFYEDILTLLNSGKDFLMIVKPAKGEEWFVSPSFQWSSPVRGRRIIKLWERLKSDPRVFWAGPGGDSPQMMAVSDLVVTHCMSSPTAEALGAGKKAIWYESGDKHRGNNVYDKIPGLVSHGYAAMRENVHRLLYGVTDEEYSEYLDRHVKGKVEPYLDGLAFTRFRRFLTSKNETPLL
ncbi:MAG: hypothetical protein HYU99_03190 [Deltaproteobacteria bacterium]|nr:hypothetical protein [Deltaproteobacteria bacterium]